MTPPCELLEWDSAFFGFTIARVRGHHMDDAQAGAVDSWSKENGVRLLYFEASINDPVTSGIAERSGFNLVDVRVVLASSLPPPGVEDMDLSTVRPARKTDLPAMVRMCKGTFQDSRFFFDARMPDAQADALYERWVEESCRGYADIVLLAVVDEKAAGFITCHLDAEAKSGQIGLVAVDGEYRGRGIGQLVVAGAQDWFASQGAKSATVVTQARNIGAQRLYNKRGFRISSASLYYHKWYGTAA